MPIAATNAKLRMVYNCDEEYNHVASCTSTGHVDHMVLEFNLFPTPISAQLYKSVNS